MDDDFSNLALLYGAIREVVGEDGIPKLQEMFGGAGIHVPGRRVTERTVLAQAFGLDLASRIVDKLKVIGADGRVAAGFEVYLPSGRFSISERARATAVEAIRGGATRAEAVARSGLCAGTISKLRSRLGLADDRRMLRNARDAALIAAHDEGLRPAEIAQRFGWSLQHVQFRYKDLRKRSKLAFAFRRKKQPAERPPRERLAASRAAGNASDDALIAAHAEGLRQTEIALRFGWSIRNVKFRYADLRKRSGLALAFVRKKQQADDALIAAHAEGLRPAEIARRFGWNVGYVHCLYARLRKRSGLALAFDRGKEQVERPPRQQPPRERLAASRAAGNARDDALIAAHDEGLLPAEIARRFGWSVGYVHCLYWELRKRSGLELAFDRTKQQAERWDGHIERRLAAVEAAFRGGRSAEEIADHVGISVTSVRTYVAKLRRMRGTPFRFDRTNSSPNARLGRERRRLIAEAYEVGMTLDDLASRTGLSARLVQAHLVRLRREAGQPFAITSRPSHAGKPRLLAIGEAAVPTQALPCGRTQERREPNTVAATGLAP